MKRPCECGECHLCAIFAASQGLPVKMPKQPTMSELAAFNDAADGKKSKKKPKPVDDDCGLFNGVD